MNRPAESASLAWPSGIMRAWTHVDELLPKGYETAQEKGVEVQR